jgi:hypothetical protein
MDYGFASENTGQKVFMWLGAQKKTGWGEGSSGLVFDKMMDT